MKKSGFISMAVVYSFIIAFLFVMISLLDHYTFRNKIITAEINEVKTVLNEGY